MDDELTPPSARSNIPEHRRARPTTTKHPPNDNPPNLPTETVKVAGPTTTELPSDDNPPNLPIQTINTMKSAAIAYDCSRHAPGSAQL